MNVVRNLNAPVFQNEPYSRSMGDSGNTGTLVLTLRATDVDAPPFGTVKVMFSCFKKMNLFCKHLVYFCSKQMHSIGAGCIMGVSLE